MVKGLLCAVSCALCLCALACASNKSSDGTAGTGVILGGTGGMATLPAGSGSGGTPVITGTGGKVGTGGTGATAGIGATTGGAGKAGTGAAGMTAGTGGTNSAAGAGGKSGAGGTAAGAGGSGGASGGSSLTGTLGALGAAKPVVNGWATTNGLETLIYLSSSPLTCAMMMTQGTKWLSTLPAGTQVIEIVIVSTSPMVGTVPVATFQGEVNYAEGSKSSNTEVTGSAGSIMLTKVVPMSVFEGSISVTAPFMLSGTFHAEWCQGGTEY